MKQSKGALQKALQRTLFRPARRRKTFPRWGKVATQEPDEGFSRPARRR
jgi:hypothetical protein